MTCQLKHTTELRGKKRHLRSVLTLTIRTTAGPAPVVAHGTQRLRLAYLRGCRRDPQVINEALLGGNQSAALRCGSAELV